MAGLSAADLDREVVLQVSTSTQDASGDPIVTWADEETIWAQWLPAGTTEAYRAQQRLGSQVDGVFRVYDRDPRPSPDHHRIVFDGRVFDLRPYVEVGRGEGLEIPAVASGS